MDVGRDPMKTWRNLVWILDVGSNSFNVFSLQSAVGLLCLFFLCFFCCCCLLWFVLFLVVYGFLGSTRRFVIPGLSFVVAPRYPLLEGAHGVGIFSEQFVVVAGGTENPNSNARSEAGTGGPPFFAEDERGGRV